MSGPRIAIVGFGAIAEKHLEVLRALGAEVVAACNRSEAGRVRASERGGIAATYDDPERMVEKERPDGLLVTASAVSLFEVAGRLIPCGLPMLLEKPPGTNLDEARALAELAARHRTPVMVGLNRRFYSVYHRGLEGMGGREAVTAVAVEWSEDPARLRELGHPEAILTRLNFANSLHGLDLLPFFAGEAPETRVWGRELGLPGSLRWQMGLEGTAVAGARVRFDSSWDVPGRWRLVVDAPGARMVSAPLESVQLLVRGRSPEELEPSAEDRRFKPGFHGQAVTFIELLRTRGELRWPACSLEGALPAMEMAERLTRACAGEGPA